MIQDVDETLRRLLMSELAERWADNPIKEPGQVTFGPPIACESATAERPLVNLYLFDIHENRALRDDSYHVFRRGSEGEAAKKRAPVKMDLAYMLTAHAGGEPAVEHALLAQSIAAFLRHDAAPVDCLSGSLAGGGSNSLLLQVAQPDDQVHTDPASLWRSLNAPLRPAAGLKVTAALDIYETRFTRLVREAILSVGQGTPPDGPIVAEERSSVRASIAGLVVSADRQYPLKGVTVSIAGSTSHAMTDERGFFYFLNLPPGAYELIFRKMGLREARTRVTAPPPGRADLLEPALVTLERVEINGAGPAAEPAPVELSGLVEQSRSYRVTLTGRLTYPDGRPASYIRVRCAGQTAITDAEGVYALSNLPPGDHQVVAEAIASGQPDISAASPAGAAPSSRGKGGR